MTAVETAIFDRVQALSQGQDSHAERQAIERCAGGRTHSQAEVGGVPVANDLESVECFHVSLQGTRPDSAIQGHSQAGRVPGSPVLAVVLAPWGGVG